MLANLEELADASSAGALLEILANESDQSIRLAILDVLRRFSDPQITEQLLAIYQKLDDPVRSRVRVVLLGRAESALLFLRQIDQGVVSTTDVTVNELRRLALHGDSQINAMVQKHWGSIRAGTPEEKLAEIRRLSNDLRAGSGDVDRGRSLFTKHCANCHRMFDDGQAVGPELTTANRSDTTFLLTSIVDPSAQVRKEFIRYNVLTTDGRIATGLLIEDGDAAITLLNEKNERVRIMRADIDRLESSQLSLMPEDILKPLHPQQVRDLFAYLQSQPKS
jgi:putative heme-binding domain-containing protein